MKNLTDIGEVRSALARYGIILSKGMGQNFLINPSVCPRMAEASDIDRDMVQIAQDNVVRAGMQKIVRTFHHDALRIQTGGRRGTVVCNPPYGERLMTEESVKLLYRNMGRHFATLDRWQIYILSSSPTFETDYGKRADKVRKLYNGMIPCGYFQYFKNPNNPHGKSTDKKDRYDKHFATAKNNHHGKDVSKK